MTSIQVNNAARKEQERSNRAREEETRRSNKAQEAETNRSNLEKERLNRKDQKLRMYSTVSDILNSFRKTSSSSAKDGASVAAAIASILNDDSWYKVSEQITKDVASIPTFQPTGTIPALDDAMGVERDTIADTSSVKDEGHRFATAGYCHFSYLPTIGASRFSTNNSDAVNITAQNIYSYMRQQVSGSVRNYERADYMMMLLAMDGPLSYYSWMKRLYGLLNYANLYNKYLPRHILNDMNVNYLDLSSKIADFRGYINQFAVRVNASCAIPSRMPYYARHQFLNTYMFSDSRSKKHQLYFFSPRKYFIWKIDPNNDATMLDLEDPWSYNSSSSLTLDEIVKFGNYMISTIVDQEDIGLMVGDTVKAFGENELVKLPEIPDNYVVEIGTSDEILDQITNIRFIKKNLIGMVKYHNSNPSADVVSVVGYEPLNGAVPAQHTYAFNVYQDTADQRIYQPCVEYVKLDMSNADASIKLLWNHANLTAEKALCFNDTQNAVEINFLTDDTSPNRVMTSTRLTPTCDVRNVRITRESTQIKEITAEVFVTSCGSEVVVEGFTSVLYWDSSDNKAKVATYELFDGMTEYTSSVYPGGPDGTPYTGNEVFISDFDYHPCINIYHTISSGYQDGATVYVRRYAKLWDRNVSTYVPIDTMSKMHAAAIMGEFNLAEIGLTPKAKL